MNSFFVAAGPFWLPLFFATFSCRQVVNFSIFFLGEAGIRTHIQGPS
jgi:hypothetical protein